MLNYASYHHHDYCLLSLEQLQYQCTVPLMDIISISMTISGHTVMTSRGVETGPADLATAGPKFSVHQEIPQLILYINNCNQATLKFCFMTACL